MKKCAKRFRILFLFLAIVIGAHPAFGEIREFKSSDGKSIHAELIDIRRNSEGVIVIELRRVDRRYFTIPVNRFSSEDQKKFREILEKEEKEGSLLKPDHRIDINFKLNRKTQGKDVSSFAYTGSTVKDKKELFRPEAVITNDELTQSFDGNRVRIVVIAKSNIDEGEYLIASAITGDLRLPAKEAVSVEGQPFILRKYEYNSAYFGANYEYGYEKDDYVVLIYNRDGEITHSRTSSNKFLENIKAVEECKAGEYYTEGLERRISTKRISSYFESLD